MPERRVVAIRPLTGEVLSTDLPVRTHNTTREVRGPGGVFGTVGADLAFALASDGVRIIAPWRTALFVCEGAKIIAGGLLADLDDDGPTRTFMAPGYLNYPNEQPYLDTYFPDEFEDPVIAYRNLWAHLQAQPDGNIGMQVDADPTYMILGDGEAPYSIIQTDYADTGGEMEKILTACKFDWEERHTFVMGGDGRPVHPLQIRHAVKLGFPRLGAPRHMNLRFVAGENVVSIGEVGAGGDEFSQDITVHGVGEGYAAVDEGLVVRKHVPDGRVRRAKIISDPSLTTPGQVQRRAEDEFVYRTTTVEIESITVIDHPNARLADINPGDDILLLYTSEHLVGLQQAFLRIMVIEESSETPGQATLTVEPSASFSYGSASNPNEDGSPYLITV